MTTDVRERPEALTLRPADTADLLPQPKRWTVEKSLHLGELGVYDDQRVELIDGEILTMSPIGWNHSKASSKVTRELYKIFAASHFIPVQCPFSVPDSLPQPDIVVIPGYPTIIHRTPRSRHSSSKSATRRSVTTCGARATSTPPRTCRNIG